MLVGHTAVARGDMIVIFGGERDDRPFTNHLLYYNYHLNTWDVPETSGNYPSPRSRHTCCLSEDGGRMYLSGGLIQGDDAHDVAHDLYWYEFATQTWNGPLEFVNRYDHNITMYNNKIWAFGGLTPEMDRVSELAWYDLETDAIGTVSIVSMEDPFKLSINPPGLHMYGSGVTGTMLDVVTASSTIRDIESSISALDLNTLKIRSIISDCHNYFDGYAWNHMLTLGSRLILLGQPGTVLDDGRLSHIFSLDLTEFGYLESAKSRHSDQTQSGTIAHDMFQLFNRSELCDFEITAIEGTVRPPLFHNLLNANGGSFHEPKEAEDHAPHPLLQSHRSLLNCTSPGPSLSLSESEPDLFDKISGRPPLSHADSISSLDPSLNLSDSILNTPYNRSSSSIGIASPVIEHAVEIPVLPTFTASAPIRVHMMLLFARWPHFSRIMTSRMTEYHSRKLHIPEPVSWVKKLIEFMYRDSIEGCTIEEAAGLLVLSNLYELPRLRTLCIEAISKHGISDGNAVLIWQRAVEADENVIRRNAAIQCLRHWGQIVRSDAFHALSKDVMIALCEEADSNGFLSTYHGEEPVPSKEQLGDTGDDDELISPQISDLQNAVATFINDSDDQMNWN